MNDIGIVIEDLSPTMLDQDVAGWDDETEIDELLADLP